MNTQIDKQHKKEKKLTVFLQFAARINGLELINSDIRRVFGRRRGNLERIALYDVRSSSPDAEEIGIGNDPKLLVVADDAALFVPFDAQWVKKVSELWGKVEGWFEHSRVPLGESYLYLCS